MEERGRGPRKGQKLPKALQIINLVFFSKSCLPPPAVEMGQGSEKKERRNLILSPFICFLPALDSDRLGQGNVALERT